MKNNIDPAAIVRNAFDSGFAFQHYTNKRHGEIDITLLLDGEEVGDISAYRHIRSDTFVVSTSYLSDAYRGKGYGAAMYYFLMKTAYPLRLAASSILSNEAAAVWSGIDKAVEDNVEGAYRWTDEEEK